MQETGHYGYVRVLVFTFDLQDMQCENTGVRDQRRKRRLWSADAL